MDKKQVFAFILLLNTSVLLGDDKQALETLPATNEAIKHGGVLYPQSTEDGMELLRFSPELLRTSKPATHGFNAEKARTTAGAWIAFRTDSPQVILQMSGKGSESFGVFQDNQLIAIRRLNKKQQLVLETTKPGKLVQYQITMPTWHNPKIKTVKIRPGSQLKPPTLQKRKTYAAIGDSITHGRGQDISHQSWGWQVADLLDLDFYNLAVGGSNANAYQPSALKDLEQVDLITILWGYNDWVNRGKTIELYTNDMKAAVAEIRSHHPHCPIAILSLLQTQSTTSKRTGGTFNANDFRQAAKNLVTDLSKLGDANIHLIHSDSMTNTKEDLRDPVHLSLGGATKLAKAIAPELQKLIEPN